MKNKMLLCIALGLGMHTAHGMENREKIKKIVNSWTPEQRAYLQTKVVGLFRADKMFLVDKGDRLIIGGSKQVSCGGGFTYELLENENGEFLRTNGLLLAAQICPYANPQDYES